MVGSFSFPSPYLLWLPTPGAELDGNKVKAQVSVKIQVAVSSYVFHDSCGARHSANRTHYIALTATLRDSSSSSPLSG